MGRASLWPGFASCLADGGRGSWATRDACTGFHRQPRQLDAEVEALICQLRGAHPRWGPRRLAIELGRANVSPLLATSRSRSSLRRSFSAFSAAMSSYSSVDCRAVLARLSSSAVADIRVAALTRSTRWAYQRCPAAIVRVAVTSSSSFSSRSRCRSRRSKPSARLAISCVPVAAAPGTAGWTAARGPAAGTVWGHAAAAAR
jgi:hypothetical protein